MPLKTWTNMTKRFGVACFLSPKPLDPDGDGDAFEEFNTLAEAQSWCEKIFAVGRFRYFCIWDGRGTDWEFVESYPSDMA